MILQEPAVTKFDWRFRLLSVPVRVHPGFWLMSLILSFVAKLPLLFLALSVVVLFVSILVHEFGHALSSRYFGERRNSVILYAMGGLCVHDDLVPRRWPQIWILLWGPLAGFLLGLLALGCFIAADRGVFHVPYWLDFVLYNLILINFAWGVVNLFPVFPLDGGQIFREIVRWKLPSKNDAFVCSVSIWTGALVACAALLLHLRYNTGLFPVLLFGILAYQNFQMRKQIIAMGSDYGQEDEAPRQPWERDPDWWKKN